jgi:hypothetical protein
MLISIRFFTERVPILPRFLNPIDLLIVPLLSPFWLIWISNRSNWKLKEGRIVAMSGLVVAAWGLSWLININGAHWLGAVLFLIGIMTPIAFYLILVNFGFDYDSSKLILKTLLALFTINLVIATFDVVVGIDSRDSDFVFGTFGVNQNQLAFFLCSMLAYFVASWLYEGATVWKIVAVTWGGVLFLLCGFQTLWVVLPVAAAIVFVGFGRLSKRLVIAIGVSSLIPILVLSVLSFEHFGVSSVLISSLERFDELGKVELAENTFLIWQDYPQAILVGVGPGSFNSRAFRSIAIVPSVTAEGTDVAGAIVDPFYRSVLSDQYIIPYFVRGRFLLSGINTDGPFTSYISIPVEIGIFGALGVFGIYGLVGWQLIQSLRKTKSVRLKVIGSWALVNLLVLLALAAVDNYLEVTRYSTLVWLSVAIWKLSENQLKESEPAPEPTS